MLYLGTMAGFTIYYSRADFECKEIYKVINGHEQIVQAMPFPFTFWLAGQFLLELCCLVRELSILFTYMAAEDPMRREVKIQTLQIFGLWVLISGWGIYGLTNIQSSVWTSCLKSSSTIQNLRKLVVIFIIEDLIILFLTSMIIPKVIWAVLKIIYERIYIKLINRR